MAKLQLTIGQRVWIEDREVYFNKSTLHPAVIVSANKSSAYFVYESTMLRHPDWENKRYLWERIELKSGDISASVLGYISRLWLTVQDYENHIKASEDLEEKLKAAKTKFDSMTIKQKKQFLEDKVYD